MKFEHACSDLATSRNRANFGQLQRAVIVGINLWLVKISDAAAGFQVRATGRPFQGRDLNVVPCQGK